MHTIKCKSKFLMTVGLKTMPEDMSGIHFFTEKAKNNGSIVTIMMVQKEIKCWLDDRVP